MQGFLGGNRLAHIFKWNLSKEDPSKWVVLLQEDGSEEVTRIGQMDTRPTNAGNVSFLMFRPAHAPS